MKFREEEISYYTILSNGRIEKIQEIVGSYFNIKPELLKSKYRPHFLCHIRYIAIKLSRAFVPEMPLRGIGLLFGHKDHTTVIHALDRAEDIIFELGEKKYAEMENKVKESLSKFNQVKQAVK